MRAAHGDRGPQPETHPRPAAGLDEMRGRAAYRITIDPLGLDGLAASAFNRLVNTQHEGAFRYKRPNE